MTAAPPISEDRPLTAQEQVLVRWLLEHGNPDAAGFLPQLAEARVVSRCPCGCPSVDFSIGQELPPVGAGMQVLADYQWQAAGGPLFGVFVFARGGLLAGLEVWSVDGQDTAWSLPKIEQLRPLVFAPTA
ncbi:hypothetical protein [Tautonia plasticadhaerens]|uniref:Uncharacterized protein n=1 Tax=Tautonia plasticadhaerens TaxID=2527974 RepID=A0A518H0A4_9BACT|nr:hypothetical protein [Tautonia plasticadhaerens]QDV34272.1 hypothetical protein ElP_21570 [Tautonia plasticadhaerens]